jgi:monofunctional biosynthetic peptidoglycan transglycosylase
MRDDMGHDLSSARDSWTTTPVDTRTAPASAKRARSRKRRSGPARLFRFAVFASFGYVIVVIALMIVYRNVDPPYSALMLGHKLIGGRVTQVWRPLDRISPNLIRAVIASEDGQFCRHRGVDWRELEAILKNFGDGAARGGSTISMQVTKNLFLWPGRSYVRKAIEIPLTLVLELIWPKRRVLEVYLNIAEWGPGVFGAEAASQFHFERPARDLDALEAALLAVSLPNPIDRDAGDPGAGTQRLADRLSTRVKRLPTQANCVLAPRGAG